MSSFCKLRLIYSLSSQYPWFLENICRRGLRAFVVTQFLRLRFRSGERRALACCRWRLANDFLCLNQEGHFGEARALPGKMRRCARSVWRSERAKTTEKFLVAASPPCEMDRMARITPPKFRARVQVRHRCSRKCCRDRSGQQSRNETALSSAAVAHR